MIVVNDLCGDEDDTYIGCEILKILLQNAIYKAIVEAGPKTRANATFIWPKPISYISGTHEAL